MNDDQHSWTYELYDVVFCKETQEEKTVHASEKGRFMYKYCPELSRQNRTIDSYYKTKFSPVSEVKNLTRYSTFPQKKWKILTSKLWRTLET